VLIRGEDTVHRSSLAEKFRLEVESLMFTLEDGTMISVTISVGLTCRVTDDKRLDQVMGRADEALYKAKHSGRNRVEIG